MAQRTTVTCPQCRASWREGWHLTGVTFVDNGRNIPVRCPSCGLSFDAAAQDGVYSTIEGHLRLVRTMREAAHELLADRPTTRDLQRLATSLAQAGPNEALADVVARAGTRRLRRLEDWADRNRFQAGLVGIALGSLLSGLAAYAVAATDDAPPPAVNVEIQVPQPSDETLERIIQRAVQEALDRQQRTGGAGS